MDVAFTTSQARAPIELEAPETEAFWFTRRLSLSKPKELRELVS